MVPHAATLPIRTHHLIKQLQKTNKKHKDGHTFTIISRGGVIYEITQWEEDQWELISYGEYRISRKSIIRLLYAPPDIVFIVFKIVRHCKSVTDEEIRQLLENALKIKRAAEPNNPLYK